MKSKSRVFAFAWCNGQRGRKALILHRCKLFRVRVVFRGRVCTFLQICIFYFSIVSKGQEGYVSRSRCFQRFLVTRKGDIDVPGPCHPVPGSRFPLTVYTGFSKETALSARIDAFTSTPLYRGTCLWTGTLPKCTLKCLRIYSVAVFYLMNFCIRKYTEGEEILRSFISPLQSRFRCNSITFKKHRQRDSPLTLSKKRTKEKKQS